MKLRIWIGDEMSFLQSIYPLVPSGVRSSLTPYIKNKLLTLNVNSLPQGFAMDLDPSEWMQNNLRRGGQHEPLTTEMYKRLLKPGDTYIDVGSHVGYFTLVARSVIGTSGSVVSIDPQPYNVSKTLTNWRINNFNNIVAYTAAISDQEGQITLHDQPPNDKQRLSIDASSLAGDMPQRFAVPLRRLDTILDEQKIDRVALLKIDAEGHEFQTIKGLDAKLGQVDSLVIEVYDPSLPQYVDLVSYLREAGFKFYDVAGNNWVAPAMLPELNLVASRESL